MLTDGDLVLYESAAICLYLCDMHPQAKLTPALGTAERAHFYKWLMWADQHAADHADHLLLPQHLVNPGNAAGAAEVKAQAERKAGELLDQLDAELARHGGPWLGQNLFCAGPLCLDAVPMDAWFCLNPHAGTPALGAVSAGDAGAPRCATGVCHREAATALGLTARAV